MREAGTQPVRSVEGVRIHKRDLFISKVRRPATRLSSICCASRRTAARVIRGSLLAPYSVDPGFLRTEALREAKQLTWQIDKQKGVATLESSEYKGPRLELPLRPMLGCIGTAPANNAAIPTSYPDNFGGNMDYNGMGAG